MDSRQLFQQKLESFQDAVDGLFDDLLTPVSEEFLSVPWLDKVIMTLKVCLDRVKEILSQDPLLLSTYPVKELTSDYLERLGNTLDFINAIRSGIDTVREWDKEFEIVEYAVREKQWDRAKEAFKKLASDFPVLCEDKDKAKSSYYLVFCNRSWSAYEKLQRMADSIVKPSKKKIKATKGLAIPMFTMSTVVYFVMWVLVAAFPCQGRCLMISFDIPRKFKWSGSMWSIHSKIMELESTSRWNETNKSNRGMLLKEIHEIAKCSRRVIDSVRSSDEQKQGTEEAVAELGLARKSLDFGELKNRMRYIFDHIANSRSEVNELVPCRPLYWTAVEDDED